MKRVLTTLIVAAMSILSANAQDAAAIENSPLYGKTINVLGDSYVRNHRRPVEETWHSRVAEKYHMTYRNYGRNGSSVAWDRSSRGFGPEMTKRYKEMDPNADYVLVIAGHNDACIILDNPDSLLVFKRAMHELCQGLIKMYPAAKLAFVTPWNVPGPGFKETVAAMEEVCACYSIPIFNALKESGIYVWDEDFRKRFFQAENDTAHLNAEGHALFMNKGERFLLGL